MSEILGKGELSECRLTPPQADTVELSRYALLDAALGDQRRDWLQGKRVCAAQLLHLHATLAAHAASAAELIYHEFFLRREAGERPEWDDYLRQFPQYSKELRALRLADELTGDVGEASNSTEPQDADYAILEEIGSGGMGIVFRASQRSLHRNVALKMLPSRDSVDPVALDRFMKEAWAVSRLNHTNIVHIYDVGERDGRPFIAFEFVEGMNLAERIGGTPIDSQLAASIVATIAGAIQYAHENDIVHRDLKPANVLLAESKSGVLPKVTDFGACKTINEQESQQRTQIVGTPAYMAPEQLKGAVGLSGVRTDVYGLGTILYECLTGVAPFRGQTVAEVLRQVTEDMPIAPRLLNPKAPHDLETICLKCLSKTPQQRYDSAAEVARELKRFLNKEPIIARPPSPIGRIWMWCCRKPAIASLLALLTVAILAGMAGITVEWRIAEAHRLRAEAEWARTEAARKTAMASDIEAQELLSELINSNEAVAGGVYFSDTKIIELLLGAEVHCRKVLRNYPAALTLRIALSNVYRHLVVLYGKQGRESEGDSTALRAQQLWEPLASETSGDAMSRDWLATTHSWQSIKNVPRYVEGHLQALAIWQNLVTEGRDPNYMGKVWGCDRRLTDPIARKSFRDESLPVFQANRAALKRLVDKNPAERNQRKRLALTCFALGEIYAANGSTLEAAKYWRESYELENALNAERSDDLIESLALARVCTRLMEGRSSDRYYQRGVSLLEQSVKRLQALLPDDPGHGWVPDLLSDTCCSLVLCHVKGNQMRAAAEASNACADLLSTLAAGNQTDRELTLGNANRLVSVAQRLSAVKQLPSALRIVRNAGVLFAQLGADSGNDPGFTHRLSESLLMSSLLAQKLGDPRLALLQMEVGRRKLHDWISATPHDEQHDDSLTKTLHACAKAQWAAGNRSQALFELREATSIRQRLFAQEQTPANRLSLTRCYDRLVFYSCRGGDLSAAAKAILERTQLWPGDAIQLAQSAEDFGTLADQLAARDGGHVSRDNKGEYDHYVAERQRLRAASKAMGHRSRQNGSDKS